jgi:carboxyl-terminal processing protease
MKLRVLLVISGVLVGLLILSGIFSAGFVAGRTIASVDEIPDLFSKPTVRMECIQEEFVDASKGGTPEELEDLFEPFWQSWNLIEADYVDQPVDKEVMLRGAIKGLLDSLGDQHTSYLDPEMFKRANATLEGEEYEGIGAWVDITGDYLTIISPMPGSPAEKAGLLPDDKVIAIDGDDMTGIDGEVVRQRIIGPEGTVVQLTILREGNNEEPFEVEVERASIVVPTTDYKILDENIAYVRLFTFGDSTGKDLKSALRKLLREKPDGLILDLRYNGGGYLDTAIQVVSEFIDDGVVMYEEFGNNERKTYNARSGGVATEIPLVVLINEGSASASEIVAGAIQDRDRGKLVGTTSFGKGSVQVYTPLRNDEGAVRITIARWLTPDGHQIMEVGLTPDYFVEITEEDFQNGVDSQLEKAIELLTQKK